jgi:integrase
MAELRIRSGSAARALEFAILTAARTGEAIGARWNEIDMGEKVPRPFEPPKKSMAYGQRIGRRVPPSKS